MSYPNWGNPYYQAYNPPMPDQLAQLRANQYQQQMQQPSVGQFAPNMQMPSGNNFQQPAPAQMQNSRIWVSSEREVTDYLVAPNSSVDLWDTNGTIMYTKQADASGKPTVKVYDVIERNTAPQTAQISTKSLNEEFVTRSEFDALKAKIEGLTANVQNKTKSKQKEEVTENE